MTRMVNLNDEQESHATHSYTTLLQRYMLAIWTVWKWNRHGKLDVYPELAFHDVNNYRRENKIKEIVESLHLSKVLKNMI
jgi:hypothetical protein